MMVNKKAQSMDGRMNRRIDGSTVMYLQRWLLLRWVLLLLFIVLWLLQMQTQKRVQVQLQFLDDDGN